MWGAGASSEDDSALTFQGKVFWYCITMTGAPSVGTEVFTSYTREKKMKHQEQDKMNRLDRQNE